MAAKGPEKEPVINDGLGMGAPKANAKRKSGGDSGEGEGDLYKQAMYTVDSISQDDEEIGLQVMWKWVQSSTTPVEGAPLNNDKKSEGVESLDDTSTTSGPSKK